MGPKRIRDPLVPNCRDNPPKSTQRSNQKGNYYLETKAVEDSVDKRLAWQRRTQTARDSLYNSVIPPSEFCINPDPRPLQPGMMVDRRIAVRYLFCQVFGSPPKEYWKEFDLILEIMTRY
jgi:hypothetical protein